MSCTRYYGPYCHHCGAPRHPWAYYGPPPGRWRGRQAPEEEKADLEEQIAMLKEELAAAEEQLKKLGKGK